MFFKKNVKLSSRMNKRTTIDWARHCRRTSLRTTITKRSRINHTNNHNHNHNHTNNHNNNCRMCKTPTKTILARRAALCEIRWARPNEWIDWFRKVSKHAWDSEQIENHLYLVQVCFQFFNFSIFNFSIFICKNCLCSF